MTYEEKEQVWSRILRGEGEPSFTLVAEIDGQIVGFAGGGPDRNDNPIFDAELFASYVRPSHQRQGIGRELVSAIAQRFIDGGMESMLVQTLAENDDAEFYMTLGAAHL